MCDVFAEGGQRATPEEVDEWTLRPAVADGPEPYPLTDFALATFLNGLIAQRRGRRDGPQPPAERALTNNEVLRKLKIAFELKTDEIRAIYALIGKTVSEHELTAFFRRPDSRQYRACNDQYLRWFLSGLQKRLRGGA